jgi:oxygen-independent coproporphyrinogen-3 oxidase
MAIILNTNGYCNFMLKTVDKVSPLSLYIHIPFCTVRCSYCAFNVYTQHETMIPQFVDALCQEISWVGQRQLHPAQVHTIYFGGGTPTLMTPAHFQQILAAIADVFEVLPEAEISTEANPNDLLIPNQLRGLKAAGINRLSIGVQSFKADDLALFGRLHYPHTIVEAVTLARQVGFENLNLDLIFGLPNQTLADWQSNLAGILALAPEHLSLYGLELEPGTAMTYWVEQGKVSSPDEDLAAEMYELAEAQLASAGFVHYEISNWSKPQRESRHNKQYWYNLPYLGFGPGAHGYANETRYAVQRSPQRYIHSLLSGTATPTTFPLSPAVEEFHTVAPEDAQSETIMMGMRLVEEGVSLKRFKQRFGEDLLTLRQAPIQQYSQTGHLEVTQDCLRLTAAGRLISNRILRDLI